MLFQDTGLAVKYPEAPAPAPPGETSFMADDPAIVAVSGEAPSQYHVVASLPGVPSHTPSAAAPETVTAAPETAAVIESTAFLEKPKRPPPPKSSLHSTPYDYMMSKVSYK